MPRLLLRLQQPTRIRAGTDLSDLSVSDDVQRRLDQDFMEALAPVPHEEALQQAAMLYPLKQLWGDPSSYVNPTCMV